MKSLDIHNKIKVSINGKEYESITAAAECLGIDIRKIRYRLKSKKFKDYYKL